MESLKDTITVYVHVQAPLELVWKYWNEPEHIKNWSFASPEWHAPYAFNDLREGGAYKTTMAACDGSMQFDFEGIYTKVIAHNLIEHKLRDGRRVSVRFEGTDGGTNITELFEPEGTHPRDMQQAGWQAILNNFKQYAEKTASAS